MKIFLIILAITSLVLIAYFFYLKPSNPLVSANQTLSAALRLGANQTCQITAQEDQLGYAVDKDALIINIRSNNDGYLTVFALGSSAELYQIFPNHYDNNNFVTANAPITLPKPNAGWRLSARKPVGHNYFFIVVAEHPNVFQAYDIPNGQPKAQQKTLMTINQLNTVLRACTEQTKNCPNYCVTTMIVTEQ